MTRSWWRERRLRTTRSRRTRARLDSATRDAPSGPLRRSQRGRIELVGEPFGQEGHPVLAALGPPLDDRALEHVRDPVERDPRFGELFRDDGQGPRHRADPEREVPGVPAHHADEEPALRRLRVLHQVADDLLAEVARGGVPDGQHVARQRQVVVDRLGDVGHSETGRRSSQRRRGRRGYRGRRWRSGDRRRARAASPRPAGHRPASPWDPPGTCGGSSLRRSGCATRGWCPARRRGGRRRARATGSRRNSRERGRAGCELRSSPRR